METFEEYWQSSSLKFSVAFASSSLIEVAGRLRLYGVVRAWDLIPRIFRTDRLECRPSQTLGTPYKFPPAGVVNRDLARYNEGGGRRDTRYSRFG